MNSSKHIHTSLNRRNFLKSSTMATAGLATYLASMPVIASNRVEGQFPVSERFFPIAAINDTTHLLQLEGRLSEPLKNALITRPDMIRMGALISRKSHSLSEFTAGLKMAGSGKKPRNKRLAMILGAVMFTGVEEALLSLHSNSSKENKSQHAEKAVYHDVAVLRGISESSKGPLKPAKVTEEEVISMFEIMWHRSLIKLHTIKPDLKDTQAWILRFTDFVENQKEVYRAYAQAYLKKKPDLYDKYIKTPNLYDSKDELLVILRSPEKRLFRSTAQDLAKALNQKEGISVYTRAIRQAYHHVHKLNGFWEGKHNKDEVATIFGA